MPILLSALLFWFFLSFQKKKYQNEVEKRDAIVREQELIIRNQQSLEEERRRIAAEMHDDIGSGLTTIRYLSDRLLRTTENPKEAASALRISQHSAELVRNMSEIIWALNTRFDDLESLIGYIRRYTSEFLEEHNLSLDFVSQIPDSQIIPVSGEKRRNLFLAIKEVLHNTSKYAGVSGVKMEATLNPDIEITITELGSNGFDPGDHLKSGNGLYNCMKRMEHVGGEIHFEKHLTGMKIKLTMPTDSVTDDKI